MADVIELTHPKPRDAKQSALFKWLLDRSSPQGRRRRSCTMLAKLAATPQPQKTEVAVEDATSSGSRSEGGRQGTRRCRYLVGATGRLAAGWHGRRGVGGRHPELWV